MRRLAPEVEQATAEEILALAVERHHPNLVMACSFQKEESVLIDMLLSIEPAARVFTIDTGVLFPETYETWRKIEDRYGLRVEVMDATPPNGTPWSASNCCGQRKVDALDEALAGADAWVTGIRFEDEVRDLALPIEFSLDNMEHFIDWQRKEPFQVIRGEGECAI
jgi:phosphoadenosine phosphosulfate reductase